MGMAWAARIDELRLARAEVCRERLGRSRHGWRREIPPPHVEHRATSPLDGVTVVRWNASGAWVEAPR